MCLLKLDNFKHVFIAWTILKLLHEEFTSCQESEIWRRVLLSGLGMQMRLMGFSTAKNIIRNLNFHTAELALEKHSSNFFFPKFTLWIFDSLTIQKSAEICKNKPFLSLAPLENSWGLSNLFQEKIFFTDKRESCELKSIWLFVACFTNVWTFRSQKLKYFFFFANQKVWNLNFKKIPIDLVVMKRFSDDFLKYLMEFLVVKSSN